MSRPEPPRSHVRHWVSGVFLTLSLAAVALILFWPTPVDRGSSGTIDRVLAELHERGLPAWYGYRDLEFSANIALFVPLAFFVALALPARLWWLALGLCAALSIAAELIQFTLMSARFGSPLDVLANTLGAAIGVGLAAGLREIVRRRDERVIRHALWSGR